MGVDQDHQVVSESRVFDGGVLAVARGLPRPLQHPVNLGEVDADVWLARYIPHAVEVTIPRGENAGHTLPYKDVVREMDLLGKWRGEAATFPAPGGDSALAEAVLVQANGAGPILAAAKR